MIVMGVKSIGHDTGAAIISDRDHKLKICAISEARLNRIKHSWRFPLHSIQYCLDAFGLNDLNKIDALYCDAHVGQLTSNISTRTPNSHDPSCDTVEAFNQIVHSLLEIDREKVRYCSHLKAHAASSYYLSPFDEATALVIDGGFGLFKGKGLNLDTIHMNGYFDSWEFGKQTTKKNIATTGVLYEFITTVLGFSGFDAGKTMALASFAQNFDRKNYFPIPDDRHNDIWNDYRPIINWIKNNIHDFNNANRNEQVVNLLSEKWVNLARQAQEMLEEDVIFLIKEAINTVSSKNLVYSGGVALSCITNRKIIDANIVDNIFIQPSSSDEGIALGCALSGYYEEGGQHRTLMDNSYLGRDYDLSEIPNILRDNSLQYKKTTASEVAKLIASGKIIARVSGKSEYGPRALGNRSILADPRNPDMVDILNSRIKHRESFRPFAPSVIYEKRDEYFDMATEGPYMNIAAPVRSKYKTKLPSVTHIDGSCRPQTVKKNQNLNYYNLLTAFGDETGIYCLINTSFNDNGEPIVETYEDAARTFLRTDIDYLFIEDYLAWKPENQGANRKLAMRSEIHDEEYQTLLSKFVNMEFLTKVIRPIKLDNGQSAIELCKDLNLMPRS